MNMTAIAGLPTRSVSDTDAPWVPLGEGKAFKPLRFLCDNRGFVELLRLEPGVEIGWHRHTGEVHAFNLQGTRELHTGERIGPGDYVYEPPGNTDRWRAIGEVPLVLLVVVMGEVDYLDADGEVSARYSAGTLQELYRRYCEEQSLEILDLAD
ncbi:cupin domain-containing protein [Microbulbifer rhizosphaerae]|uniref:Anti-sigma factor ChrR (Cupin superfamily) n=1 Tax=Microbulbifer rhizosphaerae TaxID=1562603 RepID=A0A7W4WF58_9GAMM|nr:cupin domain-containing protein [Microbulbifer rhizosphaerae]MBB3062528.1 anti-sigma factor ChrR (cupin superfamily) [Microbulbifer rhizosphaerae]